MHIKDRIIEQFEEHIIKEVDGYHYLSLNGLEGEVDAASLRVLAHYIDNLNAEWDKKVKEDLTKDYE